MTTFSIERAISEAKKTKATLAERLYEHINAETSAYSLFCALGNEENQRFLAQKHHIKRPLGQALAQYVQNRMTPKESCLDDFEIRKLCKTLDTCGITITQKAQEALLGTTLNVVSDLVSQHSDLGATSHRIKNALKTLEMFNIDLPEKDRNALSDQVESDTLASIEHREIHYITSDLSSRLEMLNHLKAELSTKSQEAISNAIIQRTIQAIQNSQNMYRAEIDLNHGLEALKAIKADLSLDNKTRLQDSVHQRAMGGDKLADSGLFGGGFFHYENAIKTLGGTPISPEDILCPKSELPTDPSEKKTLAMNALAQNLQDTIDSTNGYYALYNIEKSVSNFFKALSALDINLPAQMQQNLSESMIKKIEAAVASQGEHDQKYDIIKCHINWGIKNLRHLGAKVVPAEMQLTLSKSIADKILGDMHNAKSVNEVHSQLTSGFNVLSELGITKDTATNLQEALHQLSEKDPEAATSLQTHQNTINRLWDDAPVFKEEYALPVIANG